MHHVHSRCGVAVLASLSIATTTIATTFPRGAPTHGAASNNVATVTGARTASGWSADWESDFLLERKVQGQVVERFRIKLASSVDLEPGWDEATAAATGYVLHHAPDGLGPAVQIVEATYEGCYKMISIVPLNGAFNGGLHAVLAAPVDQRGKIKPAGVELDVFKPTIVLDAKPTGTCSSPPRSPHLAEELWDALLDAEKGKGKLVDDQNAYSLQGWTALPNGAFRWTSGQRTHNEGYLPSGPTTGSTVTGTVTVLLTPSGAVKP